MREILLTALHKPIYQALLFLLISIPLILLSSPKNANGAWLIAGYCYLGFIVMNIVLQWFSHHQWHYFFHSIGFSVAYILAIAVIMPIMIKLIKLEGSGESAMAFLFIIYHPVGLLIVMFAKWVYFKIM
ncbi:MAG: hypothetical protein ABJH04_09945 [Cyclobacteriaceae bacterium]